MADISAVITLHDQITKELHTIGVTIANTQNKLTNFKKMIEEPMASKLSDGLGKGVEKTKRLNEEIKNTRTTTETVSKSTKTVGDKISENTKKQKNFNQQLRESGKETRQLSRNIKGIIGAYASFSALRSGASLFADTSDGLTSLYARMALVNDGTHTQDEFKKEIIKKDAEKAEEEGGDVLFSLINLFKWYKIVGENALHRTNTKFIRRFSSVEQEVQRSGKQWDDFTLEELDEFWEAAKVKLNSND